MGRVCRVRVCSAEPAAATIKHALNMAGSLHHACMQASVHIYIEVRSVEICDALSRPCGAATADAVPVQQLLFGFYLA
jgi:hypothetical protein